MTPLKGPVVDYRNFYSNRGLWTNWDVPGQPAGANAFGVQYQRYDLADAAGWSNVPASYSPAKQGTFDLGSYTSGGRRRSSPTTSTTSTSTIRRTTPSPTMTMS